MVNRWICSDDDTGNYINVQDVRSALEQARAATGRKHDVIAFDACDMMMFETCYELRNECDYLVGSEQKIPGSGIPYNVCLKCITDTPTSTSLEVARYLVSGFGAYYSVAAPEQKDMTFAAVQMSKVEAYSALLNAFATQLKSSAAPGDAGTVQFAAFEAVSYYANTFEYADIFDFAGMVAYAFSYSGPYYAAAASVYAPLIGTGDTDLVVARYSNSYKCTRGIMSAAGRDAIPGGISIYMPYYYRCGTPPMALAPNYANLQFYSANGGVWKDFLTWSLDPWYYWPGLKPDELW